MLLKLYTVMYLTCCYANEALPTFKILILIFNFTIISSFKKQVKNLMN